MIPSDSDKGNNLFPVFLKLQNLRLLIVGGGSVALEKLGAVLANSPETTIRLVAVDIKDEVKSLAYTHTNITLHNSAYSADDLKDIDIVIVAVNDIPLAEIIVADAHKK